MALLEIEVFPTRTGDPGGFTYVAEVIGPEGRFKGYASPGTSEEYAVENLLWSLGSAL